MDLSACRQNLRLCFHSCVSRLFEPRNQWRLSMKMWKCQCCNPWVMNAWFSLHAAHTEGNMLNGAMYNFIYNIKRLLVLGTHCLFKPFLFQCPFFCIGISLPSFLWMKEECNNDIIIKKRENFQTSCSTHTQKKVWREMGELMVLC